MAFTDSFRAIPDQMLETLEVAQQLLLTNASAALESAKTLTPSLPELPFADRLPNPVGVTDGAFAFAGKVLSSQRDFTVKLLETYFPAKPAAAPTKATSAKSA